MRAHSCGGTCPIVDVGIARGLEKTGLGPGRGFGAPQSNNHISKFVETDLWASFECSVMIQFF